MMLFATDSILSVKMTTVLLSYSMLKVTILCLSVVQQNMRVTGQSVLPLVTKALYKFGCFKRILQKAKLPLLLVY